MYYTLNNNLIIRGWQDMPYALVDITKGMSYILEKYAFDILKLCNGQFDFNKNPSENNYQKIIDYCLEKNIIKQCNKGEALNPYQEYKTYENRYMKLAHWSITGKCNYKCKHCCLNAPKAKFGELSHKQAVEIINQLSECGIYSVSLTGGEPFVRNDFFELVDLILEKHITITQIYTNGKLITEETLSEFKKRNIFPEFVMSFDGVDGWHDWLRGVKGAFEDVQRAFNLCKEFGFITSAEMCIHQKNKHTIQDNVNFLADVGCSSVKIDTISNSEACEENGIDVEISNEEIFDLILDYIPKYFKDNMPIQISLFGAFGANPKTNTWSIPLMHPESDINKVCACGHVRNVLYISPEGRCLPCFAISNYDIQNNYPLLLEKGLKNCLSNSTYLTLIETKVKTVIDHNDRCKNCEFANQCYAGCRACSLQYTPDDILGIDEFTCKLFKAGYVDKIKKLVKSISPSCEFN